ncbi:MAG TPA: ABC transporter permease [Pseudogracilibacillus sp.]|nr:ABC transporter permease [Pseudogracilibacillus sp.]
MSFFENMKMAFSSLMAHKLRSILTMLGIIIGVGSVIAVVAIGQGGEEMLKSQFSGEDNTTDIYYEPSDEEIQSGSEATMDTDFTEEDIREIESIPEVKNVVTSSSENSKVRFQDENTDGNIVGINEEYMNIESLDTNEGRTLESSDFLAGNRSAVVSESFQDDLFDGDDMVGKVVYIGSQPVEIVGVLGGEDNLFDLDTNDLYLPFKTWQTVFASSDISELSIQAESSEELEIAGEKSTEALNRLHDKEDAYQLLNLEEMEEGIGQVTGVMTIIIGSIAGISLLVGGIGVMNIMLVSVTERTREVGIRMSLGATRGQILIQFLIESVTLTLVGGLIGMFVGAGGAMIVSSIAGWPSLVSFPVIAGGILFSMFIGVVFGILPANKAAKMDPIQALGHE